MLRYEVIGKLATADINLYHSAILARADEEQHLQGDFIGTILCNANHGPPPLLLPNFLTVQHLEGVSRASLIILLRPDGK